MGILDNLEAYMDIDPELCHYCKNKAKYTDVAKVDQSYDIVGVCQCHFVPEVTS